MKWDIFYFNSAEFNEPNSKYSSIRSLTHICSHEEESGIIGKKSAPSRRNQACIIPVNITQPVIMCLTKKASVVIKKLEWTWLIIVSKRGEKVITFCMMTEPEQNLRLESRIVVLDMYGSITSPVHPVLEKFHSLCPCLNAPHGVQSLVSFVCSGVATEYQQDGSFLRRGRGLVSWLENKRQKHVEAWKSVITA